jgi:hypothetical protein
MFQQRLASRCGKGLLLNVATAAAGCAFNRMYIEASENTGCIFGTA